MSDNSGLDIKKIIRGAANLKGGTIGPTVEELEFDLSAVRAADSGDSIAQYLSNVGRVPLLTMQDEVDLAKRIELGNKASEILADGKASAKRRRELLKQVQDGIAAFEHLILANSRLVISVARKYRGRGVPFTDLIQEGHIGLMRAAKKFEYRRGLKFSTYATWWIRQAVTRAISDQSRTIRLPVYMGEQITKLRHAATQLTQTLGRDPTMDELAEKMEVPVSRVEELIRAMEQPLSLEKPMDEENDRELGDLIPDEDGNDPEAWAREALLGDDIRSALEELPPRERTALELRYGLKNGKAHTLEAIGKQLGVTRERARQLEAQALRRLRHPGQRGRLLGYWES
ncbi:MAG: RNA polymerase sigma factor RpoD/SigA [Anaerolineales bacterium]